MVYQDRSLQCCDCSSPFTFSAEEQEFFASKGYLNDPKRCPPCRGARKERQQNDSFGFRPRRQMFPVVCAECGKNTEVPFQPRGGRPVYCGDCYNKVRPTKY